MGLLLFLLMKELDMVKLFCLCELLHCGTQTKRVGADSRQKVRNRVNMIRAIFEKSTSRLFLPPIVRKFEKTVSVL